MRDKLAGLTLRTTLLYAVFAAVCIVLSGRVVAALVSDVNTVAKLDIFKGLAFVAVTALLLYATLRRQMKWLEKEVDGRAQTEQLTKRWIGIPVIKTGRILNCKSEDFLPPPVGSRMEKTQLVTGLIRRERQFIPVLDIDSLLSSILSEETEPPTQNYLTPITLYWKTHSDC